MSEHWTAYRAVAAEGARVAFMSCLRCGAAIILDPGDDVNVLELHEQWHAALDAQFGLEVRP